jgi:hypothetical protein
MDYKGDLIATSGEGSIVGMKVSGAVRASIDLAFTPVTNDSVVFEAAGHKDGAFRAIEGFPMEDIDGTGVTSATTAGCWLFDVRGIARLRARCDGLASASIAVKINAE